MDSLSIIVQYVSSSFNMYIVVAVEQLLEPSEYCKRWVQASSDEWGYRKACVTALAEATGLSERTINNWGSSFERHPKYVLHLLKMANKLNQIKKVILDDDYFSE